VTDGLTHDPTTDEPPERHPDDPQENRIMAKASSSKTPWFDDASDSELLSEYARKLDSFLDVVADGRVDAKELEAQEKRVVKLMKEVEPLLSPEAHEKVTHLLCEVTAYDLMNAMHLAGKSRPATKFRG
jgi:hypothetical protein